MTDKEQEITMTDAELEAAIARAERAEARVAELEASLEKNIAARQESCLAFQATVDAERAAKDRAEAACAQMRAALEATSVATYPCTDAGNSAHAAMQAALASDCGVGWVSPTVHAEAVREVAYHHAKAAQAAGVLNNLASSWPQPSGHSGDEESGIHDEDCELCAWQAAQAAAEALADPEVVWVSPEQLAEVVCETNRALAALDAHTVRKQGGK